MDFVVGRIEVSKMVLDLDEAVSSSAVATGATVFFVQKPCQRHALNGSYAQKTGEHHHMNEVS